MAEKSKAIEKAAPQQIEASRPAEERGTAFYRPNVDIVDLPDEFLVLADVPGAARDDINVMFEEDVLTIDAGVAPRQDEESSRFFRREYGVGRFHRRFVVEAPVERAQQGIAHCTSTPGDQARSRPSRTGAHYTVAQGASQKRMGRSQYITAGSGFAASTASRQIITSLGGKLIAFTDTYSAGKQKTRSQGSCGFGHLVGQVSNPLLTP